MPKLQKNDCASIALTRRGGIWSRGRVWRLREYMDTISSAGR
jgi:hypothetical protein